jgi:hypothetical protein
MAAVMAWAAVGFADTGTGCDFAPIGTTASCLGPLAGSTFAGGDGNLLKLPASNGSTDWQNVAGLNPGFDLTSGTGDNAFGQGTKEDNPNVTVVNGSIPPNKSDLTRFYEASEIGSNNHNFLYLAWERNNALGSANMDFEINQKTTAGFTGTTTGPVTLNRTAGDLLVTFDFSNGGGKPTIGLQRWLTSATTPVVAGFATNACSSSNSFPCWGDQVTLDGTDSIGAVNNLGTVTDPLFPTQRNYLNPVPALQFGETAIDLTKANVFPAGTCEAFGSAFVKSRSSTSFSAEVKDFIAPIQVNISNCATIRIKKVTVPSGRTQLFNYSTTTTSSTLTPSSFKLADGGEQDYNGLLPGTYTVTEGSTTGWDLTGLDCGSGGSGNLSTATATFTVTAGSDITCTFTNTERGSIHIVKKTIPSGSSQQFGYTTTSNASTLTPSTFNLADGGQKDYINLLPGTYTATEGPTSGWDLTGLSCVGTGGSGSVSTATATFNLPAGGNITCTFTNTQRGQIHIVKQTIPSGSSQQFGYTTTSNASTLTPSTFNLADGGQQDYINLLPGTYTATEDSTSGWDLTGLSCVGTGGSGSVSTATATFNLPAGGNITCTFTNTQRGQIHIVKQTIPSGSSQSFSFTTTTNATTLAPAAFSLTGQMGFNEQDYTNLVPGTYTASEGSTVGWDLTGLSCVGTGGSGSVSTATATFNLPAGGNITCTFTNTQEHGALKIVKTSSKAAATPLANATFMITGPGGYMNSVTTGSDGTVCVDGLVVGDYSITETAAPTGYAIDNPNAVIATISGNSTCAGTPVTKTFTDTPLTDVTATATSEVPGGTSSTITCVDGNSKGIGNSPQSGGSATVTAPALTPGIYTCTINIDP